MSVLTESMIFPALSDVGMTAEEDMAFLKVDLSLLGIASIDLLSSYLPLQHLDLHNNHISDISPLAGLPYIVHLNVSGNELTEIPMAMASRDSLTTVDVSRNQICDLSPIHGWHHLRELKAEENTIRGIAGIGVLRCLRVLKLARNNLVSLDGLDGARIRFLDISHNSISNLNPLTHIADTLDTLIANHNEISVLATLATSRVMTHCEVMHNNILSVDQLIYLSRLSLLRHLNIEGNAMRRRGTSVTPETEIFQSNVDVVHSDDAVFEAQEAFVVTPESPEDEAVVQIQAPEVEDSDEMGKFSKDVRLRLEVLHILPQLLSLNDCPVKCEEHVDASNYCGGVDRKYRHDTQTRYFGAMGTGVNVIYAIRAMSQLAHANE